MKRSHENHAILILFVLGLCENIGYIYDDYKTPTTPPINYKKKFRSYNLGVPAGFKLGNPDRTFFYAVYEVEVPVLYKEKTFDGGDKTDKITGWFSDRQELFQHGPLAGVQFPYGVNVNSNITSVSSITRTLPKAVEISPTPDLRRIFFISH